MISKQEEIDNFEKAVDLLNGTTVSDKDRHFWIGNGQYHLNPIDENCKCVAIHIKHKEYE